MAPFVNLATSLARRFSEVHIWEMAQFVNLATSLARHFHEVGKWDVAPFVKTSPKMEMAVFEYLYSPHKDGK